MGNQRMKEKPGLCGQAAVAFALNSLLHGHTLRRVDNNATSEERGDVQRMISGAIVAATVALTGCASIVNDTTQPIKIETKNDKGEMVTGAECSLTNDYGTTQAKSGVTTLVRPDPGVRSLRGKGRRAGHGHGSRACGGQGALSPAPHSG